METNAWVMVIAALSLLVVIVLAVGLGGFARGGAFNRNHGNQLMRWRIILQAAVILALVIYIAIRGN